MQGNVGQAVTVYGKRVIDTLLQWTQRRAGIGAFSTGRAHARHGEYLKAVEAFKDAERLFRQRYGPKHNWVGQALAYRGWCYVKLGRVAEAIALYEQAIDVEESTPAGDGSWIRLLESHIAWAREPSGKEMTPPAW